MKHLYIKIFLVILIMISCSKDSDEGYGQTISQTNIQSNTNNTTAASLCNRKADPACYTRPVNARVTGVEVREDK